MLANTFRTLQPVVDILGLPSSNELIKWSINCNSAEKMRKKEETSIKLQREKKRSAIPFIGKATSSQWQSYFSERDNTKFKHQMAEIFDELGYE